jgi:hypothetical protein
VTGNSEALIYQRLRAHLGYLKLADAAEALPRVLDTARGQGLGLIAALEQLMAIEVESVEARRQTGRLRFASLPQPWALSDFDFSAQPGVDQALVRDLATLLASRRRVRHRPQPAHHRSPPMASDDAGELGELLTFLDDWLSGTDSTQLAASHHRFVGTDGYDLNQLRTDLARFTFLLGVDDGTQLFGLDRQ